MLERVVLSTAAALNRPQVVIPVRTEALEAADPKALPVGLDSEQGADVAMHGQGVSPGFRLGPGDCPGDCLAEVVTIELHGRALRVVPVDGRVPKQVQRRSTDRARLLYLDDEIAHFDWCGHRYALVPAAPAEGLEEATASREGHPDPCQIQLLLTNRELQIVQLVCMGLLTKQIADRLHLSEFTVRSYLKTIYCKLGVRSRGAMVYRYAQALSQVQPVPAGLP
jgi:DNA-binding CsgD family transcriptional regulator